MRTLLIGICVSCTLWIAGCDQLGRPTEQAKPAVKAEAMAISLSSDGRHLISSHRDNRVVLWDLQARSQRVVSTQGNIYSAYFIKGTDRFLWQDLENVVHVQTVAGETVASFAHFPTYGHVMSSDGRHYFSSDVNWNIFHGHGERLTPVKRDGDSPSFLGSGKLLNLQLSPDERWLVSAGYGYGRIESPLAEEPPVQPESRFSDYGGVVLWEVESLRPALKSNQSAKATATFSPDSAYMISGDENSLGYVWDVSTQRHLYDLAAFELGLLVGDRWIPGENVPPLPADFDTHHGAHMALKPVDAEYFVALITYEPYAVLYRMGDPYEKKYLFLGRDPLPAIWYYSRNAAIDSAPAAHLLVTGQAERNGINVYRFDPAAQSLALEWTADLD